ncbi:formate/nitrite transporter family protein [Rhodobacteraceae bacterium]|nr:formate/nitrite transporter family protein [Paracoccaceae bacterium]
MSEEKAVADASALNAKLIYEVIRREGEEELERPASSLIWSGIAAGILISFSVFGEAVLRINLPDTGTSYLIENLGYSFGFLLVILGRMQLFTENTITTIMPLMARRTVSALMSTLRLWGIVLAANVVGATCAAAFMVYTSILGPELTTAVGDLSRHATGFGATEGFVRAIPAGILVAAIVWMLPGLISGEVLLIVLFTWLIAAGDFTHVIAGSVEMWFLIFEGELGGTAAIFGFFLPVLAGNIVGGTAVFTLLAWGQVKNEVDPPESPEPFDVP